MSDPYTLAEHDEQRDHDAAAKRERARLRDEADWRWLLSSDRGRRIVRQLLDQCGVLRTSMHTNGSTLAFLEGQRAIGLSVLNKVLTHTPGRVEDLLKEDPDV